MVWRTSQWNLPEVDFELRTGKMSFLEFEQKNTLFEKTNYSMFHLIKGYRWAKNERNSNFELVPQNVDFGRFLQTVALKKWPEPARVNWSNLLITKAYIPVTE